MMGSMNDYGAIPDELQDREQWVCWADEERKNGLTKVPKHPDGSGKNASSTNPDTWGSFDQAVATAEERGWGIGFVFAEGGPYAGIDLDDCLNERGGPADWLPSIELFTGGTYIEKSPSGTGLHIIVRDAEVPEWWTNQHGENDGREVATFTDGRFFTFTGDALDVARRTVTEIDGLAEWLVDAWEVFNDDPPRTTDIRDDGCERPSGLSRRSREQVDLRVTDPLHAGYTPGERHEHPVHGSSTGSNFLIDGDNESFRCWRCDVTGNALHLIGMQEKIINCGDWKGTGLDTETWAEIFEAARDRGLDVPDRPEPPTVEEAEEEGWLDWQTVRDFYDSGEWAPAQARQATVRHLLSEYDFMTPRDTGSIWMYNAERGVFEKNGDSRIEALLERHLGSHYTQYEKREILGKIRAAAYCDREAFDAGNREAPLLCVANGVLNLETRELSEHSPEYRFTRGVPIDYDPDAKAPRIDGFLDDITQRPEDKRTMYEMLGNSLLPHYDHSAFLILFGDGANGKSTFFDVVEETLGDENVSGWGLQELEDNRFATSALPGKFANIAPDLPARSITQTGTIKALTGGDTMMAEEKGEPAFEFVNKAKLMFGANRPPVIQEASMAIKRRILPIHLPRQFTHAEDDGNPDAQPKHKLVDELTTGGELSGLLNAALDGADRLRETGQFSLPETPDERLEFYEQFSDPIKEFAINCLGNEQGEWLQKSTVYEVYKQFSEANDYAIRSQEVFFRQLRQVASFTYDEFQPRTDGGRARGLNATTLTQQGVGYCDSLLLSELGLQDRDETETDTSGGITNLADVEPEGHPFHDVEVTVKNVREKSKGPAYEATVTDGSAMLELVDWFGVPALGDIEEGETYRVENIKAAYDSTGTLHLQPVENTTEWTRVSTPPDGEQIPLGAAAPGGKPGEDTDGHASESDDPGEPTDPRQLAVQLATAKGGTDDARGVSRERLITELQEHGVNRERADREINKALQEGRLQEVRRGRIQAGL